MLPKFTLSISATIQPYSFAPEKLPKKADSGHQPDLLILKTSPVKKFDIDC